MRLPSLGIFLGALLCPAIRAAEPPAPAEESCPIDTEGTTRELRTGGEGKLVLALLPVPGTHVDPAAPLRISLSGSPGLKMSRRVLGQKDAVGPRAQGPRFEVPFTATQRGAQVARARIDFFVCSETWCARQSRDVSVAVLVK
ncbi:MAG TPA: hypothetical protein VFG53_19380 [Anaeromyxobacter sp.]|nr:hypothetical protein [Anaeromyxobacter sp.]